MAELRLQLRPLVQQAAAANGIPWQGLDALIQWESGWQPDVISEAGAMGLAQFMPGTAGDLDIDPFNPEESIQGAAAYLAWLRREVGSWTDALAAYNWGIGHVWAWQEDGRDPDALPEETRLYVAGLIGAFSGPALVAATSPIVVGLALYVGWRLFRAAA